MYFFTDINSTHHYTATLHALHNFSFSFTITFTFNNHKTIVEIHCNFDNNIFDVTTAHVDSLSTDRHENMKNYKRLASFRFLYLHYTSKGKLNILKFEADLLKM